MDFDPRDDRLGPIKLARTDTFPLKMQIANNGILGSLVRGNSMVSDCRLGCSPTSSTTSDGALMGNDANYMGEARLMRNDSMVSYAGSAPRTMAYHHQALPFKSSGLPLAMSTYGGVHEGERGLEHVVFTANQLRELQLHALIFKHMMCGVNVPPELVLPIRTSVAALAGMTTGAHHIASIGWGNYHLGYGNSIDPEPGRCRRTDGKKWRCSRDVVPDQKYCERHMHRGRHRARKPPEAQSTVASTITSSSGAAQPPAASLVSSPSSAVSMAAARAAVGANSTSTPAASCLRSSSFALQQQQQSSASGSPGLGVKSFSGSSNSPNSGVLSIGSSIHGSNFQQQLALQTAGIKDYRYISGDLCQEQTFFSDARGLSQESPTLSGLSVISSAVNNPLRAMQPKQQQHSFLGSGFDVGRESEGQPLRHFFDDWPRGRDPASLTWSDVEDDRSNRSSSTTQLSISIPMASTDFPSNGSSPRGKLALSPLKLSMSRAGEDDPLGVEAATQMGLGVGLGVNEAERHRQQQSSWVPITWESSSVGGPLAEVLQSSSNTPRGGTGGPAACKSSGLNLMTDAWESSPRNSPPIASSPTGVLQINATFGSFSDTSTASSPRSAALKGPEPSTQL